MDFKPITIFNFFSNAFQLTTSCFLVLIFKAVHFDLKLSVFHRISFEIVVNVLSASMFRYFWYFAIFFICWSTFALTIESFNEVQMMNYEGNAEFQKGFLLYKIWR